MVRDWLIKHTDLEENQVAVQIDQQSGRSRMLNDAVPADLKPVTEEVDCVLLIQSANVLKEPRSVARLYAATTSGVPILPVVLMQSKEEHGQLRYNFETAEPMMRALSAHLDKEAVVAIETALAKFMPSGRAGPSTFEVEDRSGEKANNVGGSNDLAVILVIHRCYIH